MPETPPGWLARRPLVAVALALILGIAAADPLPHGPFIWLSAATGCLIAVRWSSAAVSTTLLLLITFFAGVAFAQLDKLYYPAAHLARYAADDRRLANVELQIREAPRIIQPNFGQKHALPPRQAFIGDVTAVRTWAGWQPACGRVLVQSSEIHPTIAAGQTVRLLGTLDRPAPAMNPGQFDWADYYRAQRVLVSLHLSKARNVSVLDTRPAGWHVAWIDWTRRKLAAGFDDAHTLDHALLRALVLGDPDPELRDVQEQFRATGTSHHLAISGMHIAVLGGVVFFVLRFCFVRPRTAWLIAMAFVLAYGAAALPSPPVVRAVLTWLAFGVAVLSRRPVDFLHLLAMVVIAMLIYQPGDLFNAGFQLSFGTVLGLILLAEPVSRLLGMPGKDEVQDPPPKEWLFALARRIDSQVVLILAAGLTAWLVSMPMIATHFSQLNPWAIFAGIALGPIVFVALIGGFLKIITTALWPSLASVWASLALVPIAGMRNGVAWLAKLPAGDVPLPAPPGWVILAFYVTLMLAVSRVRSVSIRVLSRVAFAFAMGAMLILPYRAAIAQQSTGRQLRLTLLSVGAGQCAVVETPGGRVAMIDAGSLSLADPVRRCIGPFLRQRGITSIDTVFVTHADTDHYGSVAEVADAYDVHEVLTAEPFEREVARNFIGQSFLQSLKEADCPPRKLLPGQVVPLGTGTTVEALWPPANFVAANTNDQSLVLRLTHGGRRILFTGDIQSAAMAELLKRPAELKADVLVAPHHGSSEPITEAFIKAVSPTTILASNDRSLTQKQVRLAGMTGGVPVLRTNTTGAITVHVKEDGELGVDTQLPTHSQAR
jgi:competence protein ComEC